MSQRVLRVIGYWQDPSAPKARPDVRDFVDPGIDPEQRAAVATYLRSGTVFVAAAGFSTCRICGIVNGSTELTDGKHFVWPQGLAHYVEVHDVRLPDDVTAIAERGPAEPVDPSEVERALFGTHELAVDEHWWRTVHR